MVLTGTGNEVRVQGVAGGTGASVGAFGIAAPVGTLRRPLLTLVNVCPRETNGTSHTTQDN